MGNASLVQFCNHRGEAAIEVHSIEMHMKASSFKDTFFKITSGDCCGEEVTQEFLESIVAAKDGEEDDPAVCQGALSLPSRQGPATCVESSRGCRGEDPDHSGGAVLVGGLTSTTAAVSGTGAAVLRTPRPSESARSSLPCSPVPSRGVPSPVPSHRAANLTSPLPHLLQEARPLAMSPPRKPNSVTLRQGSPAGSIVFRQTLAPASATPAPTPSDLVQVRRQAATSAVPTLPALAQVPEETPQLPSGAGDLTYVTMPMVIWDD